MSRFSRLLAATGLAAGIFACGPAFAEAFSVQPLAPGSSAAQGFDSLPGVQLKADGTLDMGNCSESTVSSFDDGRRRYGTLHECRIGNFSFGTVQGDGAAPPNYYRKLYGDNPPPWQGGWRP